MIVIFQCCYTACEFWA